MSQELAQLRAEVAQLRAERDETWLNEQRREQVVALVHEVLADADQRATLLNDGLTAGHDGKFYIASNDGTFRLNIGGNVQLRYIANHREDSGTDDDVDGFVVRRAEVSFSGYVGNPRIDYFLQLAANRDTDAVGMQDLILGYNFGDGWRLEGGRTKAPFMREEVMSSKQTQMVERSLVNTVFSPEYVEGVSIGYTADAWRASVMLHDGTHSGSIGGTGDDFTHDTADYAITARGEWKIAGTWKQITDYEAWSGEPTSVVLGAAIDYEAGETGDGGASGAADDTWLWTADASIEHEGFSAFAAVVERHTNFDPAIDRDRDDLGFVIQSGYMVIPDKLEPFARFEWIDADADPGEEDQLRMITLGANWFFNRDKAKLTVDVVYAFDPVVASNTLGMGGPSGLGLVTDAPGEDGQLVGRAQFQFRY